MFPGKLCLPLSIYDPNGKFVFLYCCFYIMFMFCYFATSVNNVSVPLLTTIVLRKQMILTMPWNSIMWWSVLKICIMYHDSCPICRRRILPHAKQIQCMVCDLKYHMKCITLDPFLLETMSSQFQEWYCQVCLKQPRSHLTTSKEKGNFWQPLIILIITSGL